MDENLAKELAGVLKNQTEILASLADNMKTKTPSNTTTATLLHGSGGIFATPGLERDIISASVKPTGIGSILPLLPSVEVNPRFGALTGYTGTSGSQPTEACEDAPTGYVKAANLTARFGRVRFDTNTIDIDDVMLRLHRGDFTDLTLRGSVLGMTGLAPSQMNQNQILNVITASEMTIVGVNFERELSRQLWQGVTTVANEFPGLDVQIATGQKDADSGVLAPALDSYVDSYSYASLTSSIVSKLSMMEWYLRHNADSMGLSPVEWVIVMRPDLWFELTSIWPCAYNTDKCGGAVATNSTVYIDGRENVSDRDAMRAGMYLDINGRRYPVIVDTGIFEHTNSNNGNLAAGEFASTIYMLPLRIVGGFPVSYRQFVDYRQAVADISFLRGKEQFFWTDSGVYNWAIEQVKWCYKLAAKTEQRIILRTPQLAGRLDAVKYSPIKHLREPYPASPYFHDGGVSFNTNTLVAQPYAVWTTR